MPDNFDLSRSRSADRNPLDVPRVRSWLSAPGTDGRGLAALQFVPLYLVGGVLLFLLLWTVAGFLLPPGTSKLWGLLLGEALFAISTIAPAFAIAAVENRAFGEYGLPAQTAFGKSFWAGVLVGPAALSVLLLALQLLGCFKLEGVALHGLRTLKFGAFWSLYFLLVALFEEFAFRGYLLVAFTKAIGFWPTALVSSVIFGYTHRGNSGETWVGALGAAAIGLFFCFTLRRTGNLWFAVGLHASWDWVQSFFYGVPDSGTREPGHLLKGVLQGPAWLSGDPAGPEGSVLVFLLIALLWAAFARFCPKNFASPPAPVLNSTNT